MACGCGIAPASIPSIVANVVLVLSCAMMAIVGHPQCADGQQLVHTRNHAAILQGWVTAMLAAGLCGIYASGAAKYASWSVRHKESTSLSLQRSEGVRVYVTKVHLRTMLLILLPSVLLTIFMSIVPEKVCLTSEIRVMFIGATFTSSE